MATYEKKISVGSLAAGADLSAKLHYLVKASAASTVNLAGVGDVVLGVLGNKPTSGQAAEVITGVITPVVAGEAITALDQIAPDATGRARTALTEDYVCGIALTAAAAAGVEFQALLMSPAQKADTVGPVAQVGVAATKTVTVNKMVALDADGYLVDAGDSTAVYFWGVALQTVDNSAGSDGDLTCYVLREGTKALTGAGLAATDVGKQVWVGADSSTVTTTPSDILVGIIDSIASATAPTVRFKALPQSDLLHVDVGVAASKAVTINRMVCLDADGYLVDAADATAVSFWGIALATVDNTGGSDGDLDCPVLRDGIKALTGAGLAATDVGKEVWVSTDSATITTTPGNILVGIIDSIASATAPTVRFKPMPIRGQRKDRQFEIHFSAMGATLNGVKAFEDREFSRKYLPLAGYADVQTAPGGTDDLTITLSDGTTSFVVTIEDTATHGENKTAGTTPMLANTDTDITLGDTGTTTANLKGVIFCEAL